jgi:cytochrome c peroxidase
MGRGGPMMGGMRGGMHAGTFTPLPDVVPSELNPLSDEKIQLGRMLFFDPRLSRNGDVSCNSCHDLSRFGVDGNPVSVGDNKQQGTRNAPTVFNSAAHVAQFWDGRAPDVEEQAKGPVLNPVEMAMSSPEAVEEVLRGIPGYAAAFQAAFPGEKEPVTFDNMARAIASFERVLMTPSRWDQFVKGNSSTLTNDERVGFMAFHHLGCDQCHNGPTIGATSFQPLGRAKPWPDKTDQGRFEITGDERDRMVFKVPSLRNVVETAPYFHDGSVKTLEEAIRKMAEHQLGVQVTDQQVRSISAWLHALTGTLPADLITQPELPSDGP